MNTYSVLNMFTEMLEGEELCCLQRYVKTKGPKAFKVRTVWTLDKNPYSFIITNKASFTDSTKKDP